VEEWKVGDKVMGATKFGGYVPHINIDHRYAIPRPSDWNFGEEDGFLVQGLTAYYALTALKYGFNIFGVLFWFKIVTRALTYYFINSYKSKEYYYYLNLGVSTALLWVATLTFDFEIFLDQFSGWFFIFNA
jgi:hypothetical protein